MASSNSIIDISAEFAMYNIKPSEAVVLKCEELCKKYNIDGESMVDHWIAYRSSNPKAQWITPTIEHFDIIEKKVLKEDLNKSSIQILTNIEETHQVQFQEQQKRQISISPSELDAPLKKRKTTPDNNIRSCYNNKSPLSSILDGNRSDAAEEIFSKFGSPSTFQRTSNIDLNIEYLSSKFSMKDKFKVFVPQILIKESINILVENISAKISKFIIDKDDKFMLYGRIFFNNDGIYNTNIYLEQSRKFNGEHKIPLVLAEIEEYSIFPGQIVVVQGKFDSWENHKILFNVEKIFYDVGLKFYKKPPIFKDSLQLIIACGPFTLNNSFSFEPLANLKNYIKQHKPHVVILLGPFYEKTNAAIIENNSELNQTFESHFNDIILQNFMCDIHQDTKVIIISSRNDVLLNPFYPTIPYSYSASSANLEESYENNLILMPDPCMISVNDLIIGATTADPLMALSRQEIYVNKSGPSKHRMARLGSHVLKQNNFFPPLPQPNDNLNLNYSLMAEFGRLHVKPQILILPSTLTNYIKDIDGCLVINPERISKGCDGRGTFAKLEILPGSDFSIVERSSCQILKI